MTPPQDSAVDWQCLKHGGRWMICGVCQSEEPKDIKAQELARMVVEVKEYYLLPKNKWDAILAKAREIIGKEIK